MSIETNYERLIFDVSEYVSKRAIPLTDLEGIANAEVIMYRDYVVDTLVTELRVCLLSNKREELPVVETVTTEKALEVVGHYYRPTTWWDHLKETFKNYLYNAWRIRLNLKVKISTLERTKETVIVTHTHLKQTVHNWRCPHLGIDKSAKHVEFLRAEGYDAFTKKSYA